MFLILGLGNPGKKYEKTKHNVGFWVIDNLAEELGIDLTQKKFRSLFGTGTYKGNKVILIKPETYMNLSGEALSEVLNFYTDQIEDIIVVHDDLDLSKGVLKFKSGGGLAGHNGLKSIAQHLNSNDFDRVRIGIGRPEEKKVVDYVLEPFKEGEAEVLEASRLAVDGIKVWIDEGIDKAMAGFNKKK